MKKKVKIIFITILFIILFLLTSIYLFIHYYKPFNFSEIASDEYINKEFFIDNINKYNLLGDTILEKDIFCYKGKKYKYYLDCDNKILEKEIKLKVNDLKVTDFYIDGDNLLLFVDYSGFGFWNEMFVYSKDKISDLNKYKKYGTIIKKISDNWILIKL